MIFGQIIRSTSVYIIWYFNRNLFDTYSNIIIPLYTSIPGVLVLSKKKKLK